MYTQPFDLILTLLFFKSRNRIFTVLCFQRSKLFGINLDLYRHIFYLFRIGFLFQKKGSGMLTNNDTTVNVLRTLFQIKKDKLA
jgi:hypothetical protein